jgi:hypothetical protein
MTDDKALPKGLQEEEVERGDIQRPPVPYIPPVDPILDTIKGKMGTKNYKVSLPDGTILCHSIYNNNGSNKRKGFYKSYKKAKTNFEDNTSRLDLDQQKNLIHQVNNFSSILEKMQSNGIFLQEPTASSYKNQWYLPSRNQ